jgi:hypothetical protein
VKDRSIQNHSIALAFGMAMGLMAMPTAGSAAAAPPVTRGADWVSAPSLPSTHTVNMQRLPAAPQWKPGDPLREIPRLFHGDMNAPVPVPVNPVFGDDPLVARQNAALTRSVREFNTPLINQDVIASPSVSPNDPTGDIGPLQFVGSINSSSGASFAIYDKVTGTIIGASALMEALGTGAPCNSGLGDPVVLFDESANRWVLTEFTSGANVLCVYLSDVADLSGTVTWTRYSFTLPSFPDYPKYGVWPDAYYVGANQSNGLYAMDRTKMLAGQPATLQRFSAPTLAGFGFQMIQPADVAGSEAPPVGSPGIFLRHRDDEVHNAGSNNPTTDFIEMFEFHVDWTTPANSAITGPIPFPISEFSSNLNGLSAFNAFPQPSGQKLDPLRETVMHRVTYRNMGTYEVLVGNFVTDLFLGAGSTYPDDTGGVRWFELRRPLGPPDALFVNGFEDTVRGVAASWSVYQEGTWAPADGAPADQADRWMAATSLDESGNMALGYNIVRQSPAISAGLRYTGRLGSDPLGVMTSPETTIVNGSGSVSNERWGDYNDMGIDPVDGCTFWFIGNYANGGARANRVASFKFDECGIPGFTLTTPTPSVEVCANTANPANAPIVALNAAATNGFVGAVDLTFPNAFPTGITGSFTPTTIPALPGSSDLQLSATNAAAPGTINILTRGTSGAVVKDRSIAFTVSTAAPPQPSLTAPANGATNVVASPSFSWAAATQASTYLVEASTSNTFATTLFSQTVTGTSLNSPVALPTGTEIFWRVRAINICGNNDSAVFSFTTASAPGDCPAGPAPTIVASEDFEGAATGWVQEAGGTGTNTWAINTAFPFAGTKALQGLTPATASDQRFISPAFNLPSVGNGLTLSFQSRQQMESRSGGCWDGGFIEVSVGGGAYTQITAGLLTDPYEGPLGSGNPVAPAAAWCGDPQAYLKSVIDLAPYAGQSNVRFRFRVTSDGSVNRAEGWNIDNVEIKRCN